MRVRIGKLDGIADEVGDDLLDSQYVRGQYVRNHRVKIAEQRDLLFIGARYEELQRLAQLFMDIERPRLDGKLPALEFGEVKNVIDDGEQVLA